MTKFEKIVKYAATAFAALLAVSIVIGILQGILLVIGLISGNGGKTIDSSNQFELSKEINNIQVESSVGNVQIYETDGNEIKIEAENVIENYTCNLDNGTIKIKNKNTKSHIFGWFRKNTTIKIYIPKETELKKIDLSLGVGDVKIEKTSVGELIIDTGVGDVKVNDSKIDKSEFKSGVGDFKVNNCSMGNVEVQSGVGDIKLNLIGDIEEYEVKIDGGIGDKEINDKSGKSYKSEKAIYKINCDSGVGDVEINVE